MSLEFILQGLEHVANSYTINCLARQNITK